MMAETTNARTAVPADGRKEPFPPFQSDTFASQLLWLALTFAALYLLMSRLALPRVRAIFEARGAQVASDLAEAQRLREASDAALAAYEKALADARARAQGIAAEMRDMLNAAAEDTRKTLEAKLNAKLAEAEKTITATKQAAMTSVRGIAVDAAAAIVERLTGSAPAGAAVERAVDRVLKG
jgi:F-type H+-transporting ATPase subunit b